MPKVSIIILTKDRAELLKKALLSVQAQTFKDYEVVVVNDGSSDNTEKILQDFKITRFKDYEIERFKDLKIITHQTSVGITASRQEALLAVSGEYIAFLDDDDEWIDADKLAKQVKYLDEHPETVLCGGGIAITRLQDEKIIRLKNYKIARFRPVTDEKIRKSMLLRNNFFTSTVMFRRAAALSAGGFVKDQDDFAEDYDLWLRLGKLGKMYNFQEAFTAYRLPHYNKSKVKDFLKKQLRLIKREREAYPYYFLAYLILIFRIKL